MRTRVRLRRTLVVIKSDFEIAGAVQERLVHFLSPLWLGLPRNKIRSKVILNLRVGSSDRKPSGYLLFRTRVAEVRARLGVREILHFGSVSVIAKERGGVRHIVATAPSAESLFESAWATLLSILGEDGDREGFHRVHALGVQVRGAGAVLFAKGGVGKSTFCQMVLQRTALKIYGDEVPLLNHHGKIFVQALPMALAPGPGESKEDSRFLKAFFGQKNLTPLPQTRSAQTANVERLIWMRSSKVASLTRVPRWKIAAPLFRHLVIGEGVPQMAEFVLRVRNVPWLVLIFFGRVLAWGKSLKQSQAWILNLSFDPEEGWQLLNEKIFRDQRIARDDRQVFSEASNRPKEFSKTFDSEGSFGEIT
ncbi:MAG: hypothetical protein K2X47_05760 [Bdellovibrionales bacterium]|nr:hypothetical protein [Bdellovibrionales bacterium]